MQAFMLIIFEAQFYFTYKFHGDITGRPASGYMKGFVSPVRLQTYLITYSNLFISILLDSLYTIDQHSKCCSGDGGGGCYTNSALSTNHFLPLLNAYQAKLSLNKTCFSVVCSPWWLYMFLGYSSTLNNILTKGLHLQAYVNIKHIL